MTFSEAVAQCQQLQAHYQAGLQALGADRQRVKIREGRMIGGSVNIESAQRAAGGHNHTWDYGLGITYPENDLVIWIEVHDANSLHVELILDKLASLHAYLRRHAPALKLLPKQQFVWLATSRVYIGPDDRQRRRLNDAGLVLRSKRLDIDAELSEMSQPQSSRVRRASG